MTQPWTKTVILNTRSGKRHFVRLTLDLDGETVIFVRGYNFGPGLKEEGKELYEDVYDAALLTRNMAGDLAHALEEALRA